ncbi:hypothetical protein E8E11_003009 [Didymella keratinophila]|nr:hypothetical protein E8E11_003009 [Didymella keratinophila]
MAATASVPPSASSAPPSGHTQQEEEAQALDFEFQYDALSGRDALRLLKVLPYKKDDRIQIRLYEGTMQSRYRCLSYTWGDHPERFPIRINGRYMSVGKNLYEFLEVASELFPNEALWIDAICINQGSTVDKNVQVQRMGSIYRNAIDVLVWLGNNKEIAEFFAWMNGHEHRKIWDHARPYLPVCAEPNRLGWGEHEFFHHPYWFRAWITQEIIMARSLKFICSRNVVDLKRLRHWVWGSFPKRMFKRWFDIWRDGNEGLLEFLALSEKQTWQPMELQHILNTRRETRCSDPRDRFYSLLTIVGYQETVKVDYDEPIVDLFWRLNFDGTKFTSGLIMRRYWEVFELDSKMFYDAAKERSDRFQAPLRMLGCRAVTNSMELRVSATKSKPGQKCPHFSHLQSVTKTVQDYMEQGGLVLCPDPNDLNAIHTHVLLHPDGRPPQFFGGALGFEWLNLGDEWQLWSSMDGLETHVTGWTEILRVTQLSTEQKGEQWSGPHFLLKLNHRFAVEVCKNVSLYEGFRSTPKRKDGSATYKP